MKQKTNRLHFSTRTLAMVLSIVMLIGSIATGSMLSTFAAYLKEAAANSDAVSQAASEGSDIALNAIPSQDADTNAANITDNNDAKDAPDLSGFEENEIVRGMKDDFAYTAAKLDLAATGTTYYLWTSTDGGNYSSFSKVGEMTGDGTVSGSFTHSGNGNVYFIINTSSTSASSGDVITSGFSGITVTNSDSSLFNNAFCQQCWNDTAVYSVGFSMKNGNERTINVTYNPSTSTITYGGSSSGGGGTTPTEAPTVAPTEGEGGTTATTGSKGTAPARVIADMDIMFFICSYDKTANLCKTGKGLPEGDAVDKDDTTDGTTFYSSTRADNDGDHYVQVSKSFLGTYNRITNNSDWEGKNNQSEYISNATGGENVWDNDSNGHTDAVSCTTNIAPNSINQGSTVTFTTTCGAAKVAYGGNNGDLYYQYYIDDSTTPIAVAASKDSIKGSTSAQNYILPGSVTSTLAIGTHTVKTVATDGRIFYISDTDTFTIEDSHNVTFTAGSGGSISPSGTATVGEVTATTVTATPSAAYNFSGWTLGDGIVCADSSSSTISITTASSGTYTVKANFTAKPTYPITVVSNNAAYGTASASPAYAYEGQTVTLTATENTGTFSSWSVVSGEPSISGTGNTATFTMPDNAVMVKAMFNEFNSTNTSEWYYNGYDSSANEMTDSNGDQYGKRMTETKTGGVKYSYYHVEGRSETDQLFTVSKGDPTFSSYGKEIFLRTPNKTWSDGHGWKSDPEVQFYYTDQTVAKSWEKMAWDKWYGNENDSDKVWKKSIPFGARYVQFRGTANDTDNNWPYTRYVDLTSFTGNNNCVEFSNSTKDNNNQYGNLNYIQIGSSIPTGSFHEYMNNDTGVAYSNICTTGGFNSHGARSRGDTNRQFSKPNNLDESQRGDYYMIVLYKNHNYTINGVSTGSLSKDTIIWMPELPGGSVDTVKVFAKDGAIRPGYTTYARLGDTKIYDEDNIAVGAPVNDANGDGYETYTATKGDTIKIKTTIGNDYADDYYVRGFLINGEVPKGTLFSGKTADNIYEIEYTIDEDFEGKYIEVTPVYYLTDTTTNQTVSFYVDDFTPELQAIGDGAANWGNTIYAYPFYSTLHSYNNAFGQYPGQPLICYNGIYSIQIPIYDTSPFGIAGGDDALLTGTDANKKTQRKAIRISGITLHNGFYDTVHRTVMGYKYNGDGGSYQYDYQTQTYDFDDFYKIYHEKDNIDNIVFQFKHKEYAQDTDNLHLLSSFTPSDAATFTSTFGEDFEPLLNFHKRKVNIYGDAISGTALQNNPIYVVSKAGASNVENTVGHYATEWVIYKPSAKTGDATYTMVEGGGKSSIPPSLLLLNSSESFSNTVYPSAVSGYNTTDWATYYGQLASYKDCPVLITYEEAKYDVSGDKATRSDGRWLYSKNGETITSNIRIDVNTQDTGGSYEPNDSLETQITGLSAYFTNAEADGQQTYTTTIDPDKTFNFKALSSNPDYIFEGWYFDNGKGITKENEGEVERTGNYTLVARFRHHTTGILMLSHERKADAGQGFLGDGTTTMSVTVYNGDGVVVKQVKDATSTITLDDSIIKSENSAYRIMVTLSATPKGDNRFEKVILDDTTDPDVDEKFFDGNMSYTTMPGDFEFTIGDLFSDNAQIVRQLNYYSYFSAPTYLYEIKYEYTGKLFDANGDRVVQTYIKKGTMTPAEASAYVEKDEDDLIMSTYFINKIAPYEDNFGEVETWTIPESTYRQFSAVPNETNTYQLTLNGNDDNHKVHCTSSTEPEKKSITFELPYFFDGAGRAKFNDEGTGERTDSAYAENEAPFMTISKNYVLSVPYAKVPKPRYNTLSSHYTEWNDVPEVDDENYVEAPVMLYGAESSYTTEERATVDKDGKPTTETVRVYSYTPNNTQYQFQYWRIFSNKDGLEVARCYSTRFTFAALGDYTITPIYQVEQTQNPTTGMAATISYLGPSRNQWNYNGWGNAVMIGANDTTAQTASDLIFEDFVCAYYYHGEKIYKGNSDVTTGYVVNRIAQLDAYDDGSYNTDRKYYESKYKDSIPTSDIESAINHGQGTHGTYSVVNFSNTSLDNKDRIQNFYSVYNSVGWKTGEKPATKYAYKRYVYRAFAYIKDSNGSISLSDPVYFTMYDIATKEGIQ